MHDESRKVSLGQYGGGDPGLRAMREKIGDVRDIGHAGDGVMTVIEGVDSTEKQEIMDNVVAGLRGIFDPEIPLNIYDLGLIYKLALRDGDDGRVVRVEMTLTAPGCPVAGELVEQARKAAESAEGVKRAEVELVWEPQWTRERLSEAARLELGL